MCNMWTLVKELPPEGRRYYNIYKCSGCNKDFKRRKDDVNTSSLGVCRSCAARLSSDRKANGEAKTPLYRVWASMKHRCLKDRKRGDYTARGITVCQEWKNSYKEFSKWAKNNGYKEGLYLDRIDNDGNYEPSNCRWTTMEVQARNTRKLYAHNTSGFRGVTYDKQKGNFMARIKVNNRQKYIGRFSTAEEAGIAYDAYIFINNLEHTPNFGLERINIEREVA